MLAALRCRAATAATLRRSGASAGWATRHAARTPPALAEARCDQEPKTKQEAERQAHEAAHIVKQPPLLVRASLVGASTALLTPLFPIVGFNQLVFRFCDPATRMAINGGTSMLYFSCAVLAPKLFWFAPLLLPCAVANAVTASTLYLAADALAGGPAKLVALNIPVTSAFQIPVAGIGLGLGTAFAAPFLYPWTWSAFYLEEHQGWSEMFSVDPWYFTMIREFCFSSLGFPCIAAMGVAAGAVMHLVLRPIIVGVEGWAWQTLAGSVLAATVVGVAALYSTNVRCSVDHLRDVDISSVGEDGWLFKARRPPCYLKSPEELTWVPTLDPRTGSLVSEHCPVDGAAGDGVSVAATGCQEKGLGKFEEVSAMVQKLKAGKVRVFFSKRHAFFDGLMKDPENNAQLARRARNLPVGEIIVTDAVVCLVAGEVPRETVEQALELLGAELGKSSLAARLRAEAGLLQSHWASGGTEALLQDVITRVAELRELLRLEDGASPGPHSRRKLASDLAQAGVNLERARAALKNVGWKVGDDEARLREADWAVIGGHERRTHRERISRKLLFGAWATVLAGLGLFVLSAEYGG